MAGGMSPVLSGIESLPTLLAIEQARVCEYITNGALSPSNESASSQRKVKPLSGLTLVMLKRTAETPTASAILATSSSLRSVLNSLTTDAAWACASSSKSSMKTTFPFLVLILPSGSLMKA